MAEPYKIQLGVELDTSDLHSQITKAGSKAPKINIKADTDLIKKQISNIKFNKINLEFNQNTLSSEIAKLKNRIQNEVKIDLSNNKNSKNLLTLDTASLEHSLNDVSATIKEIKSSMGTLDSASGMKSLLSSINQISDALEKASNQFGELNAELKTLSSKDFSINLGIDLGDNKKSSLSYGREARKLVMPQLEAQVKYLEDLLGGKSASTGKMFAAGISIEDMDKALTGFNSKTMIEKMESYEKYIGYLKKAASTLNIDLSGFDAQFSKSANQLIDEVTGVKQAVDVAEDSTQKLKNIFSSGIDSESLTKILNDLNEIKESLATLASNASLSGLTESFDRLSTILDKLVVNAGNIKVVLDNSFDGVSSGAKEATQAVEQTGQAIQRTANDAKQLNNISIDISDGDIDDLRNALRNIKVDDASIENATKELSELNIAAKSVSATFKDGELVKWNVKGVQTTVDGLKQVVSITNTLKNGEWIPTKNISQAVDEFADEAEKIKRQLADTGSHGLEYKIQNLRVETEKYTSSSTELQGALKRLDIAMESIDAANQANDNKRLVESYKELKLAIQQVESQLGLLKDVERQANKADDLTLAKEKAMLRLKGLFGEGSEAARKYASGIQRLEKAIAECDDISGIKRINKELGNLDKSIKNANLKTQTFGQGIKAQFSKYLDYFSVASVFMYAEQGLRDMFEQVKLIDSAMTELRKVTDETDASYNRFLTNAGERAKVIGTTIDGLVNSTADFARLGYGFEDAQGLAEVANIYAVVGDEVEGVEGATTSLISTMAAFKHEMNGLSNTDFSLSIVDKLNEVSNNFAITSGGLGQALQRAASSLSAGGNSLDESIALITAGNTILQNPEKVGRLLPT